MTNEDAIKLINNTSLTMVGGDRRIIYDLQAAFDKAIKSLQAWDKFPDNVCNLLIDTGQMDKNLKWGEIIKYTPSEVRSIIKENLDKLQRGDYE